MPLVFDLADPQPACVLPGAVAAEPGTFTVGGGMGAILENYLGISSRDLITDQAVGATVQATAAFGERVALNAGAAVMDLGDGSFAFSWGARYNLLNGQNFRLAPFLANVGWQWQGEYGIALGLALEGGGERVRADLSLPAVGFMSDRLVDGCLGCFEPEPLVPLYGEAGVSFALGEHDLLRLGAVSFAPNLSWRHVEERWFTGATLHIVPTYRFSEVLSLNAGFRR